jgi:hypothetical protein
VVGIVFPTYGGIATRRWAARAAPLLFGGKPAWFGFAQNGVEGPANDATIRPKNDEHVCTISDFTVLGNVPWCLSMIDRRRLIEEWRGSGFQSGLGTSYPNLILIQDACQS